MRNRRRAHEVDADDYHERRADEPVGISSVMKSNTSKRDRLTPMSNAERQRRFRGRRDARLQELEELALRNAREAAPVPSLRNAGAAGQALSLRSRANGFIERHGANYQVELDALSPDVLRDLYTDAIAEFWNEDAYQQALTREAAERRTLKR
jgi:hypothetical protein